MYFCQQMTFENHFLCGTKLAAMKWTFVWSDSSTTPGVTYQFVHCFQAFSAYRTFKSAIHAKMLTNVFTKFRSEFELLITIRKYTWKRERDWFNTVAAKEIFLRRHIICMIRCDTSTFVCNRYCVLYIVQIHSNYDTKYC